MKYLVVILPERAIEREDPSTTVLTTKAPEEATQQSNTSGVATSSSTSASEFRSKGFSHSHHSIPQKSQKLECSAVSQRIYSKHPSGDRHPNPDYQSRFVHLIRLIHVQICSF